MALNSRLALREEDIIRISLEFLYNRELHISQLSLERETGIINGAYSDDVLFLRQLVLDGQWDDVIDFIQPLEAIGSFDMKLFKYTILRHKYIELLCIKSEAGGITVGGQSTVEGAVEEVVQVLTLLEKFAPSKEEYSGLCLLLTLPRLSDHLSYKDWNPSKARVQCFKEVFPLVEKFLPGDKKLNTPSASAKNDRLIQLVIKGLLYESCVSYCQAKATGGASVSNGSAISVNDSKNEITFCKVLDNNNGFTDSDLSLLSWLQSIPTDVFSVPFEQKTLNVDVERLSKPDLEASWTEHMLMTPIKPKIFPHSVMPFTRPRSAADIMTRSLMPSYDATVSSVLESKRAGDETFGMSRSSFASFHLTGIKPSSGKMMTSSVDRLFESDSDVFISNNFNEFQPQVLPSIDEIASINSKSPEPILNKDSPNTSTAKSSRRDSLNERVMNAQSFIEPDPIPASHHQPNIPIQSPPIHHMMQQQHDLPVRTNSNQTQDSTGGGELFEKFQLKQKINKDNSTVGGQMGGKSSTKANGFSDLGFKDKQGLIENELNCEMKMPLLMFDSKQKHYGSHNKMLMPSSYYDFNASSIPHKNALITASSSKIPFPREFKVKQRDKYTAAYNHPPPLATQQAIAMMEYELGNNLVISNSNGHYKSKLVNAVDKKSRNGASTSTSHYPSIYQQQPSQHQQYYHQQISKAKRSKSMDDFGTQMVFEQSNRVHRNNVRNGNGYQQQRSPSQMGKRSPSQNGLSRMSNHHPIQPQHKNQMRYSVDNLLEIDTSYYNNYQVQPSDANRPRFVAVTSLEDVQAVRCAEFHPNGSVYAIGSNSKTFRICEYPQLSEIREEHSTYQATVLFKRTKHHKGSIYCMAWSPQGDLIATGSNDKTVKLMRYNDDQKQLEGREIELTMHDGTVRDLCFLEDSSNKSSLLISGGAGDCKIYITDCATSTPYQALSGHGSHILSLYNWGGAMFVSGSQDKSVRFWDLRTRGCVNMVTPATSPNSRQGSPVASVCVDPSGRLLVSGHEDSSCVLYDIRGNRPIQCFKPHSSDIRSVRFSPSAYYLLSASYDNKLVLTDLQGDLTMPLPSVVVAQHSDKVISGRWHPTDFSFLSTSADKTSKLWALPPV